ncbi:MAG: hypothetical protein IK085_01300 [Clostridia bacterium]|nr:hypothetical protein [Clostridia bacterium]
MSDNYENNDMFIDWNDALESDGKEFVILEEGDYDFTVTGFERGRFPGGEKLPACNKATISMRIDTLEGPAFAHTDLFLYKTVEWKLSAFFRCIGQKKRGERLVMDWSKVVGSRGRGHFKPDSYIDKNGVKKDTNELVAFYDYEGAKSGEGLKEVEIDEDELPFV